jgi:hypothetical protein
MPTKYLLVNADTQEVHSVHESRESARSIQDAERDKERHSKMALAEFTMNGIIWADMWTVRNAFAARHPYWDWYFLYWASENELRGCLLKLETYERATALSWVKYPAIYIRPRLIVVPFEGAA